MDELKRRTRELVEKIREFNFKGILFVLCVFSLISAVLIVELSGVNALRHKQTPDLRPDDKIVTKEEACASLSKTTLLLRSSYDVVSQDAYNDFKIIPRYTL